MNNLLTKLRMWIIMFLCPKEITVIVNARDKRLNRTIHIWGEYPIYFLKCSVSAPIHIHPKKVKTGFKEYINAERQLR